MFAARPVKILLAVLAALAAVAAVAIVLMATLDFRPIVGGYLADTFGGRVRIGALTIRWGNPLGLDLKDVHVVSASWDAGRDLLRIDHAVADLNPWSLLRGPIEYRSLRVDGATLALERGPDRRGNWKQTDTNAAAPGKDASFHRPSFPTLIDFSLHNGAFTYRDNSGATPVRLQMNALAISTPAADQPVSVAADGSYNGIAAKLTATTDPFNVLRTESSPWKTAFTVATPTSTADFDVSLMDPLDFDGVTGSLRIAAQSLGDVLMVFGAPVLATPPIQAVGALTRQGRAWQWENLNGRMSADPFTGGLALNEGVGANPDAVAFTMSFPQLDAKVLAGTWNVGGLQSMSLQVEPHPGATVDGRVSVGAFEYGAATLANFAIHAHTVPAEMTVDELTFSYGGGTVQASGQIQNAGAGARLRLAAGLSGADAGQVAKVLGATNGQISGRLDGRADADMTGETIDTALKDSRGQAVVSIVQGRVARELVEELSTDLRALFHGAEGSTALTCVLAVMEVHNGVGAVAPLRLRTPEMAMIGGGEINLMTSRLNLRVGALPHSTGFFALDIPLEITGTLARPSARPAPGAAGELPDRMPALSADLQAVSDRNACAH